MSDSDSCQFILKRMPYITDRVNKVMSFFARSNVTIGIGLHVMCERGDRRTLRQNQIFFRPFHSAPDFNHLCFCHLWRIL